MKMMMLLVDEKTGDVSIVSLKVKWHASSPSRFHTAKAAISRGLTANGALAFELGVNGTC